MGDMNLWVMNSDVEVKNRSSHNFTDCLSWFLSQPVRKTRLRWAMSLFCSWPTPRVTWTTGWRPSDGSFGLHLEEVNTRWITTTATNISHTLNNIQRYCIAIIYDIGYFLHVHMIGYDQDMLTKISLSRVGSLTIQRFNYKGPVINRKFKQVM